MFALAPVSANAAAIVEPQLEARAAVLVTGAQEDRSTSRSP